jgi:hypothetical protein
MGAMVEAAPKRCCCIMHTMIALLFMLLHPCSSFLQVATCLAWVPWWRLHPSAAAASCIP